MGHLLSERRGSSSGNNKVAPLSGKHTWHILRTASWPGVLEQRDGGGEWSEKRSNLQLEVDRVGPRRSENIT